MDEEYQTGVEEQQPKGGKWLEVVQVVFWILFITIPFFTGILAYHWLPNEAPMLAGGKVLEPYEIVSSHEECHDAQVGEDCGTVVDVWKNKNTGEVFTKADFKDHRYSERNRMAITWFCYGLIGCFFAAGVAYYQKKDFYKYFGIAVLINIAITIFIFVTNRVDF